MSKLRQLPKKSVFSTKEALHSGLSKYDLKNLVEAGSITQMARGIYQNVDFPLSEEDAFRAAMVAVGQPAAICLLSALAHYGVTDQIPKKTWVMVPATKVSAQRSLKLFRTRNPQWKIGIQDEDQYRITSLERTLVDSLVYKKMIGINVGIEALRNALEKKETSLSKVMEMARSLGVLHRIISYIEALS